jgi:hypothetical protein
MAGGGTCRDRQSLAGGVATVNTYALGGGGNWFLSQYEGETSDGQFIYARLRDEHWSVALGPTHDEVVMAERPTATVRHACGCLHGRDDLLPIIQAKLAEWGFQT